jgi:hypothetical protein
MTDAYTKLEEYINGEYAKDPSDEPREEIIALVKGLFVVKPEAVVQPSRLRIETCNKLHHLCIRKNYRMLLGELLKVPGFVEIITKEAIDEELFTLLYENFDIENPTDTLLHQYCSNATNGYLENFIRFFVGRRPTKSFPERCGIHPIKYIVTHSNVNLKDMLLPGEVMLKPLPVPLFEYASGFKYIADLWFWLISRGANNQLRCSSRTITSFDFLGGNDLAGFIKEYSSYQALASAIIGLLRYGQSGSAEIWLSVINETDKKNIITAIEQDEQLKSDFNTAMAVLLKGKKHKQVDYFIQQQWPVDTSREEYSDVIYCLVKQEDYKTVKDYLKKYQLPTIYGDQNNHQKTTVHLLIEHYNKKPTASERELLQTIIMKDLSCLTLADDAGKVPLDYVNGKSKLLPMIVGCSPTDYTDKANYSRVLLYAAKKYPIEIVEVILKANTPTDRKHSDDSYFLHFLVGNCSISADEVNGIIEEYYPDLTCTNQLGKTPLQLAQSMLRELEEDCSALADDPFYQRLNNPRLKRLMTELPERHKLLIEHEKLLQEKTLEADIIRAKVGVLKDALYHYKTPTAQTALFYSIESGRDDISHGLLRAGTPLNYQHEVQDSELYKGGFLHAAAKANRPDLIRDMLARGANLQLRTGNNLLAIDIAANAGHWECVNELMPQAEVIAANLHDYQNVLHRALRSDGNDNIVKILIDNGTLPVIPESEVDEEPLLHSIVQQGNAEKLKAIHPFLTKKLIFKIKNQGKTAYELAKELGHPEIIAMLNEFVEQHTQEIYRNFQQKNLDAALEAINEGIPLFPISSSKSTLLHAVVLTIASPIFPPGKNRGSPEIYEKIFAQYQESSLWFEKNKEQIISIIKALCEQDKLMPFQHNQPGQDAYAVAKQLDCDPAIQQTLRDLQKQNPLSFVLQQPYPLHYAISHSLDLSSSKFLLTQYQFDTKDDKGITAIELAAQLNQWDYVNSLIPNADITPSQQEILGNILPVALADNQDTTIGMLLKRGAIFSMDPIETSFLFKSIKAGNPQILMMLLNWGNISKAQAQEALPLVNSMIDYATAQSLSINKDAKGKQELVEDSPEIEEVDESNDSSHQTFSSAPRLADGLLNPINLSKMRSLLEIYCNPAQYTIAAEKVAASSKPPASAKVEESELANFQAEL